MEEKYGFMVGYVNREIVRVPLEDVAGKLKSVDPDAAIVKEAGEQNDVSASRHACIQRQPSYFMPHHLPANLLRSEGLNVITLPKTIDNDLWGTDMTFGFQSAVDIATNAIDCIQPDFS